MNRDNDKRAVEGKCQRVLKALRQEIFSGKYADGSPFPSVAQIIRRFAVSNLTAVKVLDLLKGEGLVRSVQGRGTFVTSKGLKRKIGLVMPSFVRAEFFAAISSELSRLAGECGYLLLVTNYPESRAEQDDVRVLSAVRSLIEERVAGVIFQPLIRRQAGMSCNRKALSLLDRAGIPVVLCDYGIEDYSQVETHDVVGIDHFRASACLMRHLAEVGVRKVDFFQPPDPPLSLLRRLEGARSVARAAKVTLREIYGDPNDASLFRPYLRRGRPDALVCGSDALAGYCKRTLESLGLRIPKDLLLAGFDDIRVAEMLTPPLTTVRQPYRSIAETAFARLLARIERPDLVQQEILLSAPLVIRGSTARTGRKAESSGKKDFNKSNRRNG